MRFTKKSENSMLVRANKNPGKDLSKLFKEAGIKVSLSEELLMEKGNVAPVIAGLDIVDLQKMANNIDKHVKAFKDQYQKNQIMLLVQENWD